MKKALVSMSVATLLAAINIPAQAQENLIYVAVSPCRIVDTRSGGGPIPAGTSRDFLVSGAAGTLSGQGGDAAGCPDPRAGTVAPAAISAYVVAINTPATAAGFLTAFPADETPPLVATVNYPAGAGVVTGNTTNATLCEDAATCTSGPLGIFTSQNQDLVIDVQGYYYPAAGTCPDDMVAAGSICVDKYEASLWTAATGGTQLQPDEGAGPPYYPCLEDGSDCADGAANPIYAQSVEGVLPAARPSWYQAAVACANVGKRLPSAAEWQMAAAGTPADGVICNSPSPAGSGSLESTGLRTSCVSSAGAFDMVGNLWEWTADMTAAASGSTDDADVISLGEAFGRSITPSPSTKALFAPSSGPAATNDQVGFRCVR